MVHKNTHSVWRKACSGLALGALLLGMAPMPSMAQQSSTTKMEIIAATAAKYGNSYDLTIPGDSSTSRITSANQLNDNGVGATCGIIDNTVVLNYENLYNSDDIWGQVTRADGLWFVMNVTDNQYFMTNGGMATRIGIPLPQSFLNKTDGSMLYDIMPVYSKPKAGGGTEWFFAEQGVRCGAKRTTTTSTIELKPIANGGVDFFENGIVPGEPSPANFRVNWTAPSGVQVSGYKITTKQKNKGTTGGYADYTQESTPKTVAATANSMPTFVNNVSFYDFVFEVQTLYDNNTKGHDSAPYRIYYPSGTGTNGVNGAPNAGGTSTVTSGGGSTVTSGGSSCKTASTKCSLSAPTVSKVGSDIVLKFPNLNSALQDGGKYRMRIFATNNDSASAGFLSSYGGGANTIKGVPDEDGSASNSEFATRFLNANFSDTAEYKLTATLVQESSNANPTSYSDWPDVSSSVNFTVKPSSLSTTTTTGNVTIASAQQSGNNILLKFADGPAMPTVSGVRMWITTLADGTQPTGGMEYFGALTSSSYSVDGRTITIKPDSTYTVMFGSGPRQGIALVNNAEYVFMVDTSSGAIQSPDIRYSRSTSGGTSGGTTTTDCRTNNSCYKLPGGQDLWSLFPAGTSITDINKAMNSGGNPYDLYRAPTITQRYKDALEVKFYPYEATGYVRWVNQNGGLVAQPDPALNKVCDSQGQNCYQVAAPTTCSNQSFQVRYVDISDIQNAGNATDTIKSRLQASSGPDGSWPLIVGGVSEHESQAMKALSGKAYYDKYAADLKDRTFTYKLTGLKPQKTYAVAIKRLCFNSPLSGLSAVSASAQTLLQDADSGTSGGSSTTTTTNAPKLSSISDVTGEGAELTTPQGEYTHVIALTMTAKEGASEYRILISTGPGANDYSILTRPDGNPYDAGNRVDMGGGKIKFNVFIKNSQKYVAKTLAVVALNADGVASDPVWKTYTVEDPFQQRPAAVTNLKVDPASVTATSAKLTWNDTTCYNFPVAKTFRVYNGDKVLDTVNQTNYTVNGLTADKEYNFSVKVICDGRPEATNNASPTGSIIESTAANITVRTLKGLTGNFTIEGRVEAAGKYDDGTPAYRLIVKRTSNVSGMTDKWYAGTSNDWLSSFGSDGLMNFMTGNRDGANKRCSTEGYCVAQSGVEEGYVICTSAPGSNEYVSSTQFPGLMLSSREAVVVQWPAGLAKTYVQVIGFKKGSWGPSEGCRNIDSAPIKSNELLLDIPTAPDAAIPTLTFSSVETNDKTAHAGFVTGKQVTFKFTANDDKDISKCTIDFGKGETDIPCKLGENEVFYTLPDDLAQGDATFKLTVVDGSGKKTTAQKSYQLDYSSPTFSTNAESGYVQSLSNLVAKCEDANGSGCLSAQYKVGQIVGACAAQLDGWQDIPQNSLGNFVVPSLPANANALCLRGRDVAGNFNEGQKFQLNIDSQTPEANLSVQLEPGVRESNGAYYTNKDEISIRMTELNVGASGIGSCDITGDMTEATGLNKTDCTATDKIFKVRLSSGDGLKKLIFKLKSKSGTEGTTQITIQKDTTRPTFETNTTLNVVEISQNSGQGRFKIVPAAMRDNALLGYAEFVLKANGSDVTLSTDNLDSSSANATILNNKILVATDATGAFPASFFTTGVVLRNLPVQQNGQNISYTLEQRAYDKADNASSDARTKTFSLADQVSTQAITVTGGTVEFGAQVDTNTIPLSITFSGSPVFYTISENGGAESAKFAYSGSIFLSSGDHTNVIVRFYDAQGNKIGNDYGPRTVKVAPKGAALVFAGQEIERTKNTKATVTISSITSASDSVSYEVTRNGSAVTTGTRNKADFNASFALPEITLVQDVTNEIIVTLTDSAGQKTLFKKTIVQDTKAPDVRNASGQVNNNQRLNWSFIVDDAGNTPLTSISARLVNTTTGERSNYVTVPLNTNSSKEYNITFSDITPRPGHEYVLSIVTEDSLGNRSEDIRTTTPVVRAKSAIDNIDMLQKAVALDGSIITSEDMKVILTNRDITYVAQLPKGKSVVFGDLLAKGGNEKNGNARMTKLPVGTYVMTIETVGLASKKTQTINNYVVEPYFSEASGDLNGDGRLGYTDRYLYDLGRAQGKYQGTTSEMTTLMNAIDTALRNAKTQNIDAFLKN